MKAYLELPEMPESCEECPIIIERKHLGNSLYCPLIKRGFSYGRYERNRHANCSLKPVKEDE